jgi:8-oxo-dGTP diphosphatase
MSDVAQRRASRLILLDPEGRVLLFRHAGVNRRSFWAPPGGGLEGNETFEQAALREASEELGLNGVAVRLLWERMTDFVYIDGPVRQHECFFLLEGRFQGLSAEVLEVHEREGILEIRWWTPAELQSTKEPVFPDEIVSELKKISPDGRDR